MNYKDILSLIVSGILGIIGLIYTVIVLLGVLGWSINNISYLLDLI